MCKDEKKATEAKVEDEKTLTEEELDKVSGGSGHFSGPIYDWDHCIIAKDGKKYPRLIWPDENTN